MQDGTIKGTGNSWNLKSVPNFLTLYPTYEAFVEALVDGTLPIDLNGMNPTGWAQMGTLLSKANLLKDATAALYGLGAEAVPDEVLAKAGTLINTVNGSLASKAWFAYGSYIGASLGGHEEDKTINCGFKPQLAIISMPRDTGELNGLSALLGVAIRDAVANLQMGYGQSGINNYVRGGIFTPVWGPNSIIIPKTWNTASMTYRYFLFG